MVRTNAITNRIANKMNDKASSFKNRDTEAVYLWVKRNGSNGQGGICFAPGVDSTKLPPPYNNSISSSQANFGVNCT